MAKAPAHPLDSLFRTKLRDISWKQFQAWERATPLPQPCRWTDPKTGLEWSLMGRKADLMWRASNAHAIRNHTTTCHAIEQAIRQGDAWRETVAGHPDVLVMWLASMREGIPHARTQSLLARAMKGHRAGLGKPGDGGYLDTMLAMMEQESLATTDPARRLVMHQATSEKWLNGVIFRSINPGSGDWRPVCEEHLPLLWPIETIERVFGLARMNATPNQSVIYMASGPMTLVEQLSGNDVSARMADLMVEDALASLGQPPHACLAGLEHYHSRGAAIDPRLIQALVEHANDPWMDQFPRLRAEAIEQALHTQSPMPATRKITQSRL